MEVGKELRRIREAAGLSAKALAEKLQVNAERLRKWELRGVNPREMDEGRILSFFGIEKIEELSDVDPTQIDWNLYQVSNANVGFNTSDGLKHSGVVIRSPFLTKAGSEAETEIPYYDYDFIMGDGVGTDAGGEEVPAYIMKLQGFPHCISFPTFGDSMERLIKSGSIVFARLVEWKDYVEYGQIYGIVMADNRRFLKYIRKSKTKEATHFLLRSENEQYDDFEIPKDLILKVWLIEGWINRTH